MQLEVLGNWGGAPGAGGASSGYLVQEKGTTVLLDCGPGVLSSLQRNHRCADLDAVFITHMHIDHCLDLLALASRLRTFSRRFEVSDPTLLRPLPVFLPPGGVAMFKAHVAALGAEKHMVTLELHEQTIKDTLQVGSLGLRCHPMDHGVPCQAVRIGGFAYSGDSRLHDGLADVAREADLFLCEASARDPNDTRVTESFHLTGAQAGKVASAALAKKLMLTHFTDMDPDWRNALLDDAANEFNEKVLLADYGSQLTIEETPSP